MAGNMKLKVRLSGIDVIGEIPWGTHICHFYETAEDLISLLVPYFKAGLENNEMCIWITAEPIGATEAKDALREALGNLDYYDMKNQIHIFDYHEFYHQAGAFASLATLTKLLKSEQIALKSNFDGIRISGNTSWLHQAEWADFVHYESAVDASIRRHRIIAICSYSLQHLHPAEIIDVVSNHRNILLRRDGGIEHIANNGYEYITKLRSSGLSYQKIGRIMGVSRQRIAQILRRDKEDRNKESTTLLTSKEAAEFLNVHANTIRRWSDNGIISVYRVGQRKDRKFRLTELQEFKRKANGYG